MICSQLVRQSKVAVFIHCQGSDLLSAPSPRLLPTVWHRASCYWTISHICTRAPLAPEAVMLTKCVFLSFSCGILKAPSGSLCHVLAPGVLSHAAASVSSEKGFLCWDLRRTLLPVIKLSDCHCANCTLNHKRWLDWPRLRQSHPLAIITPP